MSNWARALTGAGIVLCLMASRSEAQQAAAQPGAQPQGGQQAFSGTEHSMIPSVLDATQAIDDFGKVIFKAVDSNNDNRISQEEALDAANLVVGGFFFRADLNGDGIVTTEEARQAMQEVYKRRPWLRYFVERAQSPQAEADKHPELQNIWQIMTNLVDTDQDKRVTATEARQAVKTTVQSLFAQADTNHDGYLTPIETNAAVAGIARTAWQTAFQMADKDRNGTLSKEEYLESLRGPAVMVFAVLDANKDGQLSQQELDKATEVIVSHLRALRVPDSPNTMTNLLKTGQRPEEAAPVPNVAPPTGATNTAPTDRSVQPSSATIPTPSGAAPAPVSTPPR